MKKTLKRDLGKRCINMEKKLIFVKGSLQAFRTHTYTYTDTHAASLSDWTQQPEFCVCVAVRCSVVVCCSVLQLVAVRCGALRCAVRSAVRSALQAYCSAL